MSLIVIVRYFSPDSLCISVFTSINLKFQSQIKQTVQQLALVQICSGTIRLAPLEQNKIKMTVYALVKDNNGHDNQVQKLFHSTNVFGPREAKCGSHYGLLYCDNGFKRVLRICLIIPQSADTEYYIFALVPYSVKESLIHKMLRRNPGNKLSTENEKTISESPSLYSINFHGLVYFTD